MSDADATTRPRDYAAVAFAYCLALALFTKLTRAWLLASSTHGSRPWVVFPLVLGLDLVFVSASAFTALGLARIPWRAPRVALSMTLLVVLVLVHVFDIGAQELIGSPFTFQRLRGDEGAHITDLGLVGMRELAPGLATILAWILLIWVFAVVARGVRWIERASEPRVLGAILIVGLSMSFTEGRYLRRTLGLDTQSAMTFIASTWESDGYEGHALTPVEWKRLLTPTTAPHKKETPPPPLPEARPKNVIIFLAEGIPFEHTGFAGNDTPNPTPHLTARVQKSGFLFSRYYAHWHASNQAIFSVVCSSLPPLGGDIMGYKPRIDCGEYSQVMRENGRHAGLFHGGHFSFYNKLALLGRRGYEVEQDAEELMLRNKRWQRTRWGTDDRAMVDATLKWVDSLKGQPFSALLITIAPHYPFELPRSWRDKPFSGASELPRFLNGIYYIDNVFDELIRGFEARGLADDTLFVFLGDHGMQVAQPPRTTPGRRSFYEASLHVPLVLINPKLFPPTLEQRSSDRVAGHVDLLPTLLDALGDEPDARHHGQSMFRNQGWPRRLFFAANNGKYIGFVDNDHKFVFQPRAKQAEYYDLAADPSETKDLGGEDEALMRKDSEDAVTLAEGLRAQIDAAPVLDEKITMAQVYTLFRKNVTLQLDRDGVKTPCPASGADDQRVCPGVGAMFRQKDEDIQGEKRRCLRVKIPENTVVRLRVSDPTTLSLLTSTTGAIGRKEPSISRFHITTDVDGLKKFESDVGTYGAQYIDHPRGQKYLEYAISRSHAGAPDEICLQLTKAEK